MITLTHLWPLALLLLLPLVWRLGKRTATGLTPRHLRWVTWTRSAVIILLALALARPVWNRTGRWISVVYALDISSSVSADFINTAVDWMASSSAAAAPAHVGFVAFASRPEVVAAARNVRAIELSQSGGADGLVDREVTDIEAGVREALRSFDPRYLKRLVLITDGNETAGDFSRVLGRLQQDGVRVFTMPASVGHEGDAWVEAIGLPEDLREDEPVAAEVRVFSRAAATAVIELLRDEEVLDAQQVDLAPGVNPIPFEVALQGTGEMKLTARLRTEGDSFAANDVYLDSVWVESRPRVLYVEGAAQSAHYLRQALEAEGIDVTEATSAMLPARPEDLADYDAVILSDVSATGLGEARMRALEMYVRDQGGGLIFAGGENSYGEEGYAESPVEEILPVWFRIDEKRKDLALVIVLDKSFSMVGPKIELSKEAAKAALELLDETHRFGLLTFDHSPYWTVPLQFATNKPRINEFISSIIASAHTNIYPALEKAYLALVDIPAEVKHVILLSDGKTYPDDYETLVNRMVEGEITVSTVAVGEEADQDLLGNIAEWGNGRSYFIRDAERVPQIFIEETQLATKETLIEESFDLVVRRRIEAFEGVDFDAAPALRGYVSTQAKDTAEVVLESGGEDPILARWQYGLGKTALFASDVKNRWAADWLAWEGYGKFWAQLVRETMRRQIGDGVQFTVHRDGKDAVLAVEAIDAEGYFLNELDPRVEATRPDGARASIGLAQVAPGAYETRVPLQPSSSSPYRFELSVGAEEDVETGEAGAPAVAEQTIPAQVLYYPYVDELRLYPPNDALLRAISDQTGGKFVPEDEEIFADYGDVARIPTPLWPWLAGLALIAYLLDIALRRAPWFWHRFGSGVTSG